MNPDSSTDIWKARPSHYLNTPWYALTLIYVGVVVWLQLWWALALAPGIPLWSWLEIQTQTYRITADGRFLWTHGILNRKTEFIELYRIKDFLLSAPVHLRPLGLANLTIITSDPSTGGKLRLQAIPRAEDAISLLRPLVEKARMAKGVREIDGGLDF